jgi:hypothetical protein
MGVTGSESQVEMEPHASVLVSFSDALETRICGRDGCDKQYAKCSEDEKSEWRCASNTCNTNGVIMRWICGECMKYYESKKTTYQRGVKATFIPC